MLGSPCRAYVVWGRITKQLSIEDEKLVKKYETSITHRSTCCSKCTDTFADCCCPTIHSSYSASCKCRDRLSTFFLVSKQMYQDALEAFYTKACFEFIDSPREILSFCNQLPPAALGFIRNITFRVQSNQIFCWDDDNYLQQWQIFILFIKDNFNVSNLSLTITQKKCLTIVCARKRRR